jgi:DNA (cytosine-5)-methyltransferase 1
VIDLFAGCGGLTEGFERSGRFRSVLAVEFDGDAAETYRVNFASRRGGPEIVVAPIQAVADWPEADIVVGGPPCQGFSLLNRNGVGPERRALWEDYARALEGSRCRAFVMENVPGLLKSDEYQAFLVEADRLEFKVEPAILNAADYGVPQTRRRAIVIGYRGAQPHMPEPTHSSDEKPQLNTKPWVTVRQAIGKLPREPDEKKWHRSRRPLERSLTRYKAVPPDGGNRFQMQENLAAAGLVELVPPCWRNKPSGTTDVFGRMWWDRPAPTIRTEFYKPEKGRYLHPEEDRPITVREAAILMSFPPDFKFPENQSMTSVGRQIGNAVPPLLAQRIAETVATLLDNTAD